jgi:excisionase family DNA binding protein
MNALEVFKHDTLTSQMLHQSRQNLLGALEGSTKNPSDNPSAPLEVALAPALLKLLLDLLEGLEHGQDMALIPLHSEISPQDAATLLSASRPYVMDLIKAGLLTSRRVGSHHRIPLEQVMAFRQQQESAEAEIGNMTQTSQVWGLGYE